MWIDNSTIVRIFDTMRIPWESRGHHHHFSSRRFQDTKKGMELLHRAARSGNSVACGIIAAMYARVPSALSTFDVKVSYDINKAMRLYARAAKLGDPIALYLMGHVRSHIIEPCEKYASYIRYGKCNNCAYYFLASASGGFKPALDEVKMLYTGKHITKDEYAGALRSYQAVHDEM